MVKRIVFTLIILFSKILVSYCGTLYLHNNDSIFIISDNIDKNANSFDLVLVYKKEGKEREIFRTRNQDYSIELTYKNDFVDQNNDFSLFFLEDLPTGQNKAIFFDKKKSVFYHCCPVKINFSQF